MTNHTTAETSTAASGGTVRKLWTIPSMLSGFRLLASPLLIPLAWSGSANWCFGLFVVLLLSDWLDGKLAKALRQQTSTGARLDSCADAVFYACVLISMVLLKPDVLRREQWWITVAVASYLVSISVGVFKFRRLPSYHTWMAKSSWLLVSIAIISVFAGWSAWPLRVAMAAVFITNLEATAISLVLPQRHVDVPTIWHARRLQSPPLEGPL